MRFVPVTDLQEDMVLGRTLYNANGDLLLSKGNKLKKNYIEKIINLKYNGIYISDELSKGIEIVETVSPETKTLAVTNIKETFLKIKNKTNGFSASQKDLKKIIDDILEEILENADNMINMIDLKIYDDYTFYHSVNVAILSVIIGIEYGLSRDELKNLCLSGILHDIGKVYIPEHILNKEGLLTKEEREIVQLHPKNGYSIIKEKMNVPTKVYIGILYHHERYDGTGYPDGLRKEEIPLFSRILAIADVYDALISDRPYRKGLPPSEAIEYLLGNGGLHFDPHLLKLFCQKVALYPVGTFVKINKHLEAIVIKNHEGFPARPVAKVIKSNGQFLKTPFVIDLREPKYNTVTIK